MLACRYDGERARSGLAIAMVVAAVLFALPSTKAGFDAFRWALFYAFWISIGLGHGLLDLRPLRWRTCAMAVLCYAIVGLASWLLWMRFPLFSLLLLGLLSAAHLTLPWAQLGAPPNLRGEAMRGVGFLLVAIFSRWPEVAPFLVKSFSVNEAPSFFEPTSLRWLLVVLGALAVMGPFERKTSRQERFIRGLVIAILVLLPVQVGFGLYFLFMHAGPDLIEADAHGAMLGRALFGLACLAVIPIAIFLSDHGGDLANASASFVFLPLLILAAPHILWNCLKIRQAAFPG